MNRTLIAAWLLLAVLFLLDIRLLHAARMNKATQAMRA